MGLITGTRLGPYEILNAIGAGGMGEVYKARDTRLDRIVALKTVNAGFSERFEREARAISALNHPNICTLHDIGEERPAGANEKPVCFLVMEYVDGTPLTGPRPIEQVVRYGIQMCDALEAAHRKGIVHRDLKPANILVTKAGIKLLDFGLAKRQSSEPSEDLTVAALTGAHTIVGTPQYMSPEQIEGGAVDARSDLFSLGCVLYELITGAPAFTGKTTANVMAAVLASEPRPIAEVQPAAPAALVWIITRCLDKDAEARWQSAHDIALQLKPIAAHAGEPAVGRAPAFSGKSMFTGVAIGSGVAGLAAAAWLLTRPPPVEARPVPTSLAIVLAPGTDLPDPFNRPAITLSPDGRTVAFAAAFGGKRAIYLRALGRSDIVKVDGTDGGEGPLYSPDGQWLAFSANGLNRIPIKGGAASPIRGAAGVRGAAWFPDDWIVFSRTVGGLLRVPALGGDTPLPFTTLDASRHEKTHRSPVLLPGGKAMLFVSGSDQIETYDDAQIFVRSLDTDEPPHVLVKAGYSPVYSPTGHVLYAYHGGIWAVPFDPIKLVTLGPNVEVVPHVATAPNYGTAEFDVSRDGTLVYVAGGPRPDGVALSWADRHGNLTAMPIVSREYQRIAISPNGKRIVLLLLAANGSLWTQDIDQSRQPARLTGIKRDVGAPVWTPDSSKVTYRSSRDVRWISADGSGPEEVLIPESETHGRMSPESWSPNGNTLALTVSRAAADSSQDGSQGGLTSIAFFSLLDKTVTLSAPTRFSESSPRISPDGKWLAYVSDESGHPDVYVRAMSGSAARYPVTAGAGTRPLWNPNGHEILYSTASGMMSVQVETTGASFSPHTRMRLLEGVTGPIRSISIDPTGQRFAVLQVAPLVSWSAINVVLNWASSLPHPPR